jgi:transcription-repair coupling factor (superfamily II helicase)
MNTLGEIQDFKSELIDRFGKLMDETANLFLKVVLKILSVKAGVKRLDLKGSQLTLYFSPVHQRRPFGLVDMVASDPDRFNFSSGHMLTTNLKKGNPGSMLGQLKNILKQIAHHVNN